jgi:hypothetical protein
LFLHRWAWSLTPRCILMALSISSTSSSTIRC